MSTATGSSQAQNHTGYCATHALPLHHLPMILVVVVQGLACNFPKRPPTCRDALLEGSSSGPPAPRETEQTAELDNQGLLGLQQQLMKNQDTALETMEKTVINTKVRSSGVYFGAALLVGRFQGVAAVTAGWCGRACES